MKPLHLVLTALLLSPAALAAQEVVLVRSGQVAGSPGAVGQTTDNSTCWESVSGGMQLTSNVFGPNEFGNACSGSAPFVIEPVSSYVPTLACDPDARWIHSKINSSDEGRPPRSVLYCFPFEVQTQDICQVRLRFCWAVDDRLGDPGTGTNLSGVYVNGVSASPWMIGGNFSTETTVNAVVTAIVNPGWNMLQVYARDTQNVASGLLCSARFTVVARPPCHDLATAEVLDLRSGQVGGFPAQPGMEVSDVFCTPGDASSAPIPFAHTALGQYCGQPPFVVSPYPGWLPSLPCDPDARWINWNVDGSGYGKPPRSVVYCIPFFVTTQEICHASLDLCWAVDDRLGDPSGGLNPIGAYINGVALGPPFTGGGFSFQSSATQNVTGLVNPGWNTLYLYQRDMQANASGLIYSANFRILPTPPCPPGSFYEDYCGPAADNSASVSAELAASGSDVASDNDFVTIATNMPPNQFGYVIASQTQAFTPHPGGSDGNLCVGGTIARFTNQVMSTGQSGSFEVPIDLTSIPLGGGTAVHPGETWNFQIWFRDMNPGPTSNFTNGISVTFQ